MKTLFAICVALFLSLGAVVQAQETSNPVSDVSPVSDVWKVLQLSGVAHVEATGAEPVAVESGQILLAGQTLKTGPRTRLMLSNGKQHIQVSSNTTLSLPPEEETKPDMTIVRQTRGTITLSIDKQKSQHFKVQTPYLVAVVKGTEFTVSIDDEWAKVRVHEGVVEVKNQVEDEAFDVKAGEAVTMNVASLSSGLASGRDLFSGHGLFMGGNNGTKAGSARLTFSARGEDSPEEIETVRHRQERERWRASPIGRVGLTITDGLAIVIGYLGEIINTAIGWVTGLIVVALSPFIDLNAQFAGINYWVRVALVGVVVGLILGLGSLCLVFFRRR
ncbi:FecR family protein [Cohaesibacter haloalkalitolerans]|uniref:FecR family protein n=1 Tax=Cohaesibacter haloalkalitolerans TaxID=1162980 RepID=UPI0013C3E913|nr:FecR family protein [Cohaesibacter haloalkalitolerans]